MKIKMVEQIIDVPDEVGDALLKNQELMADDYYYLQSLVPGLKEGYSYQLKVPVIYEKVGE
jgi:hypothetical protein